MAARWQQEQRATRARERVAWTATTRDAYAMRLTAPETRAQALASGFHPRYLDEIEATRQQCERAAVTDAYAD